KSREADTTPRQPSATLGNARNCKRFLAGAGLLERINYWNHRIFLCELVMFHLAAGQPCFMGWQNRKTALRLRPADPAPRAVFEHPEKRTAWTRREGMCPTRSAALGKRAAGPCLRAS